MADLTTNLGGFQLKNPVMTASGTFGYGTEFSDFIDISRLGGIIVKGTTLHHREGNAYPRMAETPSGMLNAVGLQNRGVEYFAEKINPTLAAINTNVIVNVSGSTVEDYVATAEKIAYLPNINAIELNISCPNVKQGGMAFGTCTHAAEEVVSAVRKVYPKHLMVKLSPNVTDIVEIAKAAQFAGADSVSLINTLLGMAINAKTRRPVLSTVIVLVIFLLGIIGYSYLGVREYPSVDNPIITVSVSYPGANAEIIENQEVKIIEFDRRFLDKKVAILN